jgi:amidase
MSAMCGFGLEVMSQRDMRDPWWVPAPLEWPPMTNPIKVALARIPADMDTDPEVIGLVRTAADHLASIMRRSWYI